MDIAGFRIHRLLQDQMQIVIRGVTRGELSTCNNNTFDEEDIINTIASGLNRLIPETEEFQPKLWENAKRFEKHVKRIEIHKENLKAIEMLLKRWKYYSALLSAEEECAKYSMIAYNMSSAEKFDKVHKSSLFWNSYTYQESLKSRKPLKFYQNFEHIFTDELKWMEFRFSGPGTHHLVACFNNLGAHFTRLGDYHKHRIILKKLWRGLDR